MFLGATLKTPDNALSRDIRVLSFTLVSIDQKQRLLFGLNRYTGSSVTIVVSGGARINGEWGTLAQLQVGDFVDARMFMDKSGRMTARELETNLWEGLLAVRNHLISGTIVQPLDRHTKLPMSLDTPSELSPTVLLAPSPSNRQSRITTKNIVELVPNSIVRAWGRKRAESRTIAAFLVEHVA